jgi:predicted glycosyltransferase
LQPIGTTIDPGPDFAVEPHTNRWTHFGAVALASAPVVLSGASIMAKRILVYAQHLSGVGHYVRTYEIARALAAGHEVYWVDGGRPVPHRPEPGLRVVELPRIRRGPDGALLGLDPTRPIGVLMRERVAELGEAARRVRPEVFLVEYFPFSQWALADELLPTIEQVRAAGGQVLCSLRDVVRKTRFETAADAAYSTRVTDLLNRHFDALLVHADPSVRRLDEHFPAVADINVPIRYTGLVSEKPAPAPEAVAEIARVSGGRPYVLASAGGGAGGRQLISAMLQAWHAPAVAAERMLITCGGLDWALPALPALAAEAGVTATDRVRLLPFRADFLHWLAGADLSISHCGYNTAANLLEARARAVVSPNPEMSDQPFRARRLADRGLMELVEAPVRRAELIRAMTAALSAPQPAHDIDLDGAVQTRRIIETEA